MRSFWMAASVALLALAVAPAHAAKEKIALVPAHVFKGNPENGKIVTDAVRRSLEKAGYEVLPAGKVDAALSAGNVDLGRAQNLKTLGPVRTSTGADYVVYPRVLSVGVGLNGEGVHQANILVNVIGKSATSFVHTRQVGQEFKSGGRGADASVISPAEADVAAGKLLELFYAKKK